MAYVLLFNNCNGYLSDFVDKTISNERIQFIKERQIMPIILMTLLYQGAVIKPPDLIIKEHDYE